MFLFLFLLAYDWIKIWFVHHWNMLVTCCYLTWKIYLTSSKSCFSRKSTRQGTHCVPNLIVNFFNYHSALLCKGRGESNSALRLQLHPWSHFSPGQPCEKLQIEGFIVQQTPAFHSEGLDFNNQRPQKGVQKFLFKILETPRINSVVSWGYGELSIIHTHIF